MSTYQSIFMDIADVMAIHKRSQSWAARHYRKIMKHFQLKRPQRITIYNFCEFEGIPQDKCLAWLVQQEQK